MGARINFVFTTGDDQPAVWLYSHWGEENWEVDLAKAIWEARSRWEDPSYATRIIISQLIGDQWESPTGFGIGAVAKASELNFWDPIVIVDMTGKIVREKYDKPFDAFCHYHLSTYAS
jgi:hypothetical protein